MITLTYGTRTLELHGPTFGNKESLESRRIYRKTRGGDLDVYRDDDWPETTILDYDFNIPTCGEDQVYQIIDFLKASLGQEVTLEDYEGRTWNVIILTPAEELIESARESLTFKLQFQEVVN
jgi:hypothetical protein